MTLEVSEIGRVHQSQMFEIKIYKVIQFLLMTRSKYGKQREEKKFFSSWTSLGIERIIKNDNRNADKKKFRYCLRVIKFRRVNRTQASKDLANQLH